MSKPVQSVGTHKCLVGVYCWLDLGSLSTAPRGDQRYVTSRSITVQGGQGSLLHVLTLVDPDSHVDVS